MSALRCGEPRCTFTCPADEPDVMREHLFAVEGYSHASSPTLQQALDEVLGRPQADPDRCPRLVRRAPCGRPVRYAVRGRGTCERHLPQLVEAALDAGMDPAPVTRTREDRR